MPLEKRLWMRIAEAWRGRIGRPPWLPGARLPCNTEIAREFGASESRAQQALLALKREGLLERVPGRGTLVAAKAAERTGDGQEGKGPGGESAPGCPAGGPPAPRPKPRVGILLDESGAITPYNARLARLLCGALAARGVDARLRFFDPTLPGARNRLSHDVRETGFALFFSMHNASSRPAWATLNPPIPVLGLSAFRYRTYAPGLTLWERIAAALKRVGAKRPAFATGLRPEVAAEAFAPGGMEDIPAKDLDGTWAARFRLALWNRGIRPELGRVAYACARPDAPQTPDVIGKAAYDAVKRLLAANPPPDALVVHPDELVPGVVAAILESGLSVPRDLRCVFHCNRGMRPFAPFPVEWIENDPAADADIWAGHIAALLRGEPLPRKLSEQFLP